MRKKDEGRVLIYFITTERGRGDTVRITCNEERCVFFFLLLTSRKGRYVVERRYRCRYPIHVYIISSTLKLHRGKKKKIKIKTRDLVGLLSVSIGVAEEKRGLHSGERAF